MGCQSPGASGPAPHDDPTAPMPPTDGPQPTPMPIYPLPGEGGVPDYDPLGTGDLADLGLQQARSSAYDANRLRPGRRVWNSRLGRYV